MLGLNLEWDVRNSLGESGNEAKIQGQIDMEHDAEETPIESGDGKKRPRKEI